MIDKPLDFVIDKKLPMTLISLIFGLRDNLFGWVLQNHKILGC